MNIYDISKKAGVSIATVSRVMNGSENVSEKTRERILNIMKEAEYVPNAFARGLCLNTIKTIGLLCADCSDHFLASAIYHLEQGLRAQDYDCILCCTGYELEDRKKYIKLLLSKKVDAIVLIGSTFIEKNFKNNQYIIDASNEVPIININGFFDSPNVYCTLCDDAGAICDVTTNMLKKVSSDILFVYRTDSYSGIKKLEGFKRAYNTAGIDIKDEQILCFNDSIGETTEKLLSYYEKVYKFTSIVAGDDEIAVSALKFAKHHNFSIPDDFSIVGYNNSKVGICCEPELSTIDNQLTYVCHNAVQCLMDVLDGQSAPNKTMVSGEFIERGTTKIL